MADDICSVCGLPQELCVCENVEKERSLLEIKVERRKYGKYWAVISGFDSSTDLKTLLKAIKSKMACGGTVKERNIEVLLGKTDKSKDLVKVLTDQGYPHESIHVSVK